MRNKTITKVSSNRNIAEYTNAIPFQINQILFTYKYNTKLIL